MRISAKAEYASVAMVELAIRNQRNLPTSLKMIAEQYGISQPFLMQIFLQLKGAGLVTSIRGASGGYQLAKTPDEIRLADIVDVIDGPPTSASALSSLQPTPLLHALQGVWSDVQDAQRRILEQITLADLQKRSHEAGIVFYQI